MIRVIIERQLKPECFDDYSAAIRKGKKDATRKPGFMGGELYYDQGNKNHIVIIAAWDSVDNWKLWYGSEQRIKLTESIQSFVVGDEKITVLSSQRI